MNTEVFNLYKILVVDDEAKIRELVKKYAVYEGHEVTEAGDGMEAVEICKTKDFDIIILDIMMPELDGFSACREIRKTKNTPVVMLSARGEEYDRIHGFEIGIDDYVVKPFSISDLVPAIEIAVSRHRQLVALQQEVGDLHERLETRKVIDRAKGILMATLKLSEPDAFSWIQRTAMDRRMSMKDVALAVISPDAVPDSPNR